MSVWDVFLEPIESCEGVFDVSDLNVGGDTYATAKLVNRETRVAYHCTAHDMEEAGKQRESMLATVREATHANCGTFRSEWVTDGVGFVLQTMSESEVLLEEVEDEDMVPVIFMQVVDALMYVQRYLCMTYTSLDDLFVLTASRKVVLRNFSQLAPFGAKEERSHEPLARFFSQLHPGGNPLLPEALELVSDLVYSKCYVGNVIHSKYFVSTVFSVQPTMVALHPQQEGVVMVCDR